MNYEGINNVHSIVIYKNGTVYLQGMYSTEFNMSLYIATCNYKPCISQSIFRM